MSFLGDSEMTRSVSELGKNGSVPVLIFFSFFPRLIQLVLDTLE